MQYAKSARNTDCDFVNTLPEADQSFIGMPCSLLHYWWLMWWLDHDYFLPSAIQHHHQLLLLALQLVILAMLGPGQSTAVNHVRYTDTMILRNDAVEVSLSVSTASSQLIPQTNKSE
jgi:hypothetical protein